MKKITGILFAAAAGLIMFLGFQCRSYILQNRQLQEELADKDRLIKACVEEMRQKQEAAELAQARLTEILDAAEYETETGFVKKGGFYLIDSGRQLSKLAEMVREGEEIEQGVDAAEASYRLRDSLEMQDWFSIGTQQRPFNGTFDGDGHYIKGKFVPDGGETEGLIHTGSAARIRNLDIRNGMDKSPEEEVCIGVDGEEEVRELEQHLEAFPDCRVWLRVEARDLEMQETSKMLKERWDRNGKQDGYYVSLFFWPFGEDGEEEWKPGMPYAMTPFSALAGESWGKIIETAVEQEEGCLRYMEIERIGGLTCCLFEVGGMSPYSKGNGEGYHILLEGEWEGKQIQEQHLYIPYTEMEMGRLGSGYENCVEAEDIDFDGKKDLLIHEGYSSGSGGSWSNYRAVVWREETGEFEYYPSFPEQLVCLEFDRQRDMNM